MHLARNIKTDVTGMGRYRILVWKRHHPLPDKQHWSMEADTKTMPLLYLILVPCTAGINQYKVVLEQYRICVSPCLLEKQAYTKYILFHRLPSYEHTYTWGTVLHGLLKCLSKNERGQRQVLIFFVDLPTSLIIKIADEYEISDKYYCLFMESYKWLNHEFENICVFYLFLDFNNNNAVEIRSHVWQYGYT